MYTKIQVGAKSNKAKRWSSIGVTVENESAIRFANYRSAPDLDLIGTLGCERRTRRRVESHAFIGALANLEAR